MTFLGLELQVWLGFTVVGAIVSTLGALLGIIIKDYFFARSFEVWKQRRTLEQTYQRFRDPLLLSARELASRLAEVVEHYPTVYLTTEAKRLRPERQLDNSTDDPYFRHYKLTSSIFRFCAFLGWLELYRQEITYLHSGNNKHTRKLEASIAAFRADIADGQLNEADDWLTWRDTLVFREELRAVGEAMIEQRGAVRTVLGYGRFCELYFSESPSQLKKWSDVIGHFLLDLETKRKDFRRTRLTRLVVHLVDLVELLGDSPPEAYLKDCRETLRRQLGV